MSTLSTDKNERLILETLRTANSALRLKNLKLNSLLEITNAINNNFSKDQLLKIFEFVLRSQLGIERVLFINRDERWSYSMRYGLIQDVALPEIETDLGTIRQVIEVRGDDGPLFGQFEAIVPVIHKSTPLAYLLLGGIREDMVENTSTRHIPFIQTLANIITVAIENKRLAKENIRQAQVRKEMELASEVQNMLFPSRLPKDEHLEIAAYYQPHQQVGGDYYDFLRLSDNEIGFCMADVSGKGVSAALLMANFQANLRALYKSQTTLTDLVQELNAKVMDNAMGEKFITLFVARYNMVTRVLSYVNAGQNPPVLLSGNTTSTLSTGCIGLGMLDEIPSVREGVVTIEPGAMLLCYTDGVTELENARGKEFGISKLELILLQKQEASATEVNAAIIEQLKQHKGTLPYIDDIALLCLKLF